MDRKYYIAYGSNMAVDQMEVRCPEAKVVGTAILNGWQLRFKRYATIEPNPNANTPVLVWEISERDEKRLDRYEGFPSLYFKKDLEVNVLPTDGGDPVAVTAMVYIMDEAYTCAAPFPDYYMALKDAYEAFRFPMQTLTQALRDSIGDDSARLFLKRIGVG